MNTVRLDRRTLTVAAGAALLGGCSLIPGGSRPASPVATPDPTPVDPTLPDDDTRHRVALLLPMSGTNGAVGQAIANATTMALLDTNASNVRITTYDTAKGPQEAAREAVAEGNKLILGPLLGSNVPAVVAEARKARVPMISFSNDTSVAAQDVFVMGHIPEQSIGRTVEYARTQGARDFALLKPDGAYGARADAALRAAIAARGGRLVTSEPYSRANTSIVSAAQRLKARGGYDTVLIAEAPALSIRAANELIPGSSGSIRLLGTELWNGENSIARAPALGGALFSFVTDARYKRFVDSYEARFGSQPYRIATLGYDAVLLTLNVARDWQIGSEFPLDRLRSSDGFMGLDGAFRFQGSGVVQRAMEVRQVQDGKITVVDPAPSRF